MFLRIGLYDINAVRVDLGSCEGEGGREESRKIYGATSTDSEVAVIPGLQSQKSHGIVDTRRTFPG